MADTLYIIGNGFDRYHKLDTRYQSFGIFLKENHSDIYELLINYFGLPSLDEDDEKSLYDPLWADFESALAELEFETVLEDKADYLANPASQDFRDRDWHAYQFEMKAVVDKLTAELCQAFKTFILAVEFPDSIEHYRLQLERNSLFLNFNYTDTLERFYHIRHTRILYIHGRAKASAEKIILGHGIDPKTFEQEKKQPPAGLNEEELALWREDVADESDFSYASGKSELMSYFYSSFKATGEVIAKNEPFFASLSAISQVFVLGHSISPVDQPYFRRVIEAIKDKSIMWHVTYYSEDEFEPLTRKLLSIGLASEQINLIKMDNLKLTFPELF